MSIYKLGIRHIYHVLRAKFHWRIHAPHSSVEILITHNIQHNKLVPTVCQKVFQDYKRSLHKVFLIFVGRRIRLPVA